MSTIKDVKSNDYAYFDGLSNGQVVGSVKNAFRYIVSLSNMTGTYIDDWDAKLFFKEDRWLTDKGDINREFFARKSIEVTAIPGIAPSVAAKLEMPLKNLFSGGTRTYRDNIASAQRDIGAYYGRIHTQLNNIKINQEKLLLAELAAKTKSGSQIDMVRKILSDLPVELWSVDDNMIGFLCKTDTIVPNRDKTNRINRSYNLGRLIFKVSMQDLKVYVDRRDNINRWVSKNEAHFHYGSYFCAGGFAQDLQKAQVAFDLHGIIDTCLKWKDTYDGASTLTSSGRFNHHPAFTTYEPDDFLFGKTELDLIKHCYDSNLFYCDPMVRGAEFVSRIVAQYSFTHRLYQDNYSFALGGGMKMGHIADKESPLLTIDKPWEAGRYKSGEDPLNYEAHREWLNLCKGEIWNWADFSDGDEAPTPPCGVYDPLFADNGSEDGDEPEWITLDSYRSRFGEYPPGHERDEEDEDR